MAKSGLCFVGALRPTKVSPACVKTHLLLTVAPTSLWFGFMVVHVLFCLDYFPVWPVWLAVPAAILVGLSRHLFQAPSMIGI